MRPKPLIIGQAPGPNSDPGAPLSGRCGVRLAGLCGLTPEQFLDRFRRINLIERFPGKNGKGDHFPIDEARKGAVEVLMTGVFHTTRVVLLGENVARAFGFRPKSYPILQLLPCGATRHGIAFCPHPSAVSHWWNDVANVEAARAFWTALAKR